MNTFIILLLKNNCEDSAATLDQTGGDPANAEKINNVIDKYLKIGSNPVLGPVADGLEKLLPEARALGKMTGVVSILYDYRLLGQGEIEQWQFNIRLGWNAVSMLSGMPMYTTSYTHENSLKVLSEFSVWLENYVYNIPSMIYNKY